MQYYVFQWDMDAGAYTRLQHLSTWLSDYKGRQKAFSYISFKLVEMLSLVTSLKWQMHHQGLKLIRHWYASELERGGSHKGVCKVWLGLQNTPLKSWCHCPSAHSATHSHMPNRYLQQCELPKRNIGKKLRISFFFFCTQIRHNWNV